MFKKKSLNSISDSHLGTTLRSRFLGYIISIIDVAVFFGFHFSALSLIWGLLDPRESLTKRLFR